MRSPTKRSAAQAVSDDETTPRKRSGFRFQRMAIDSDDEDLGSGVAPSSSQSSGGIMTSPKRTRPAMPGSSSVPTTPLSKLALTSPKTLKPSRSTTFGPKSAQQKWGIVVQEPREEESDNEKSESDVEMAGASHSLIDSEAEVEEHLTVERAAGPPRMMSVESSMDIDEEYPPPMPRYVPNLKRQETSSLPGETPSTGKKDDTIPVRNLDQFTIFRDALGNYRAVGHVCPEPAQDSEDDDDEGLGQIDQEPIELILSNIEGIEHEYGEPDGSASIWIQTKYAWYRLQQPSKQYYPHYQAFYTIHLFTQVIWQTAISNPETTWQQLKDLINNKKLVQPDVLIGGEEILGHKFTAVDLEAVVLDIRKELLAYGCDVVSPLIKHILGPETPSHPLHSTRKTAKKPQTQTLHNSVSPLIHDIANSHFLRPLHNVQPDEVTPFRPLDCSQSNTLAKRMLREHERSQGRILLGETTSTGDSYRSLIIDGVTYVPGDIVIVVPGEDEHKDRATGAKHEGSQSLNQLANSFWFVEIVSIFLSGNEPMLHGRWFQHGSKTVLKEAAHTQELFLLNECNDISVRAVVGHSRVQYLPQGGFESQDIRDFFYRFLHFGEEASFVEASQHQNTKQHFKFATCYVCALKEEQKRDEVPRKTSDGAIIFKQQLYHRLDFVYIQPSEEGVFILGQITRILVDEGEPQVRVMLLGRQEDIRNQSKPDFCDERQLYLTGDIKVYDASSICGKFYIIPHNNHHPSLEDWLLVEDHFYIKLKGGSQGSTLAQCKPCMKARIKYHESLGQVPKEHCLKALDIFSGCGGFNVGLDQTGYISTRWSIELNENAAQTLEKNMHEEHIVLKADVNQLLQDVYDPLVSTKMPPKDKVDLIYCGPPCQSFSRANSEKKADDPRHSLSMTALSFVDWYRPQYFILENVLGMTLYSLVNSEHKAVKMGIIKVILRCLISMGYQVRFNVLQAAAYGAPQSRQRLIILAAQTGFPLPNLPQPTHAFQSNSWSVDLTDGMRIDCLSSKVAALRGVSALEAISDLPKFHWKDLKFSNPFWGFENPVPYRYPEPLNRYQKWVRNGSQQAQQHFTKSYSELTSRRVINVPQLTEANWANLPKELHAPEWSRKAPSKYMFKRIVANKPFPTSTCTVEPASRGGQVIHPNQKRVITLREYARSQGFPDTFKFYATQKGVDHLLRQVGNAVPVPLAIAIGREIGKAVAQEAALE